MKLNHLLNHTASHVLAAAVLKLYPNTKIAIGPTTDEGFYYDFDFDSPLVEKDLIKIEKQMRKIIATGASVIKVDAVDFSDQPYKLELISELKNQKETITFYGLIDPNSKKSIFSDLCSGPHIDSLKSLKHFKLLSLAGAYWKGDVKNKQLTRIYGTAWDSKEELESYLELLQERKERDHRKIGPEMNIFMFHHLSGHGFPFWLEDGMVLKNRIQKYIRYLDRKYHFKEISTPAFGSLQLYKTSGHWQHYQEDMYQPIGIDEEQILMRPMTCPHHILLFKSRFYSYRDLPVRFSEQARLYRYEKSGALTGLERVRSMELTEGHIFCRPDQVLQEFKQSYLLIREALEKFDIKIAYISLSLRDPQNKSKYYDDDLMWNEAENDLRKVLNELEIPYEEKIGEAAFYGPKLDVQIKTVLNHEITISTLQLDFLLPKKFDITYVDHDQKRKHPVFIHRGLIGTYERFVSILLEQTKGDLPFWLAPRQFIVIPVNNEFHHEFATNVYQKLWALDYEVQLDDRNERLAKKIRESQKAKVKFQIVIGDEEVNNKFVTIRKYGQKDTIQIKLDQISQINFNKY